MDDFMMDMIPIDFEVKQLVKNDASVLYYRFKDGYVHFVKYGNNTIDQTHILRYKLAVCFNYLFETEGAPPEYFLADHLMFRKVIAYSKRGTKRDAGEFTIQYGLDKYEINKSDHKEFFKLVVSEVKAYNKAYAILDKANFNESLKGYNTLYGSELTVKTDNVHQLLPFIFDTFTLKNPRSKTLLSYHLLYSRMLDKRFVFTKKELREIAQSFSYFDPEQMSEIEHLLNIVQYNVFGEIFWSKESMASEDELVKILSEGFNELTIAQQVMLKSIYKQHHIFILVVLAFITGEISEGKYLMHTTGCYQPDSKEEQSIRYHSALINFFNETTQMGNGRYLGYRVELPKIDKQEKQSYSFFDPHLLTARNKAGKLVKSFKEGFNTYEGVKLYLVFCEYDEMLENDNRPNPEVRFIEILSGKRMHTPDILSALDFEARVLQGNCGESFPIMETSSGDEKHIAVNQFFVTLYYFTA